VGIKVGGEAVGSLIEVGERIKRKYPFVSLVPASNLHITLRFFGEISKTQYDELCKSLDTELGEVFNVSLTRVGGFPTEFGARVVWVGLDNEDKLVALSNRIDALLKGKNLPDRDKPFVPHITILRTKKPINVEGFEVKKTTFSVKEIVIFESILAKPNAIYKSLKSISLAGH